MEQETQNVVAPDGCQPFLRGLRRHKCVKMGVEDTLSQSEPSTQPRASAAQTRAAEKARISAEQMASRPCKLPSCGIPFVPARPQDWKSEFCCREHQKAFWVQANQIAAAVITRNIPNPLPPNSEFQAGVSHTAQVLAILERNVNEWVEHPRQLLPNVVWNSRIAELRKKGHVIETRMVGTRPYDVVAGPGGRRNWRRFKPSPNVEYQYKLVRSE